MPLITYGKYYQPYAEMVWDSIYSEYSLTPVQRRLMREAMLPDEWTPEIWQDCKKFWGGKCAVCGSDQNLQRDHIVPVASIYCPGAVASNLLVLCKVCNQDKLAQDFAIWYADTRGNPAELIERIWDWQETCFQRGYN